MKKILAIDFGKKKIGLAVADLETKIPLPLKGLNYQNEKDFLEKMRKIIKEEEISCLVLGLPLSLDFQKTPLAEEIIKFGRFLEKELKIPVDFENEVFSSEEVDSYYRLIQRKTRGKIKKKNQDSLAAVVILESYLRRNFHN